MKNIRIVFFGTPSFVIPVLGALEQNFDLVGVVTTQDQKVGRHQILTPSPVKKWAEDHKITVLTPTKLSQDFNSQFSSASARASLILNSQLIVVASYGKIIPQEILDIPKFGAINIHPSLLPKYRGASPIQSAILNGDKVTGISIIKMDSKMDHGPVIYAEKFKLSNLDTFECLSTNMFARSAEILPKIIPQFISRKITLKPQDDKKATYTKIVKKEDGYFDINNPPNPEKFDQMIRGYYPWPNTWTHWEGKIVKFFPNNIVQMGGKKPVAMEDFLRGHPNFPTKKF